MAGRAARRCSLARILCALPETAQDEASAEQFGMPRSAIETGCVDRILPLPRIAAELKRLVQPSAGNEHRQL
jgi:chemotaxis response regulator CheB